MSIISTGELNPYIDVGRIRVLGTREYGLCSSANDVRILLVEGFKCI